MNCDKIMQLRFNFDACPMHSPFAFVHLMHQNLCAHALFCHNSLAKAYRVIKRARADPIGFFSKLLRFWCHKNCYIFLIIILKFHAVIPCRSEEIIKNVPILSIMVVTTINN